MAATDQSAPPVTATSTPFKSFADMVDYPTMYAELAQRGITLTDDEKQRCEAICGDRLRNHDGGQVIGNSIGGTIQGLVYTLFAFLKNMFSGNFGGLGDMASGIGNTISTSGEQGKLFQLQLAESETYERLKKEGGNLASAAEYITGMKPYSDNSASNTLQASVLNQVGRSINLPVTTNTSLNATSVADATPPTGLPPRLATQPLTQRL